MECTRDEFDRIKTAVPLMAWEPGTVVPEPIRELYTNDPKAFLLEQKHRAPEALQEHFFKSSSVMSTMRYLLTSGDPMRVLTFDEIMQATGCTRASITGAVSSLQNAAYSNGPKMFLDKRKDQVRRTRWWVDVEEMMPMGPYFVPNEANDMAGLSGGLVRKEEWK